MPTGFPAPLLYPVLFQTLYKSRTRSCYSCSQGMCSPSLPRARCRCCLPTQAAWNSTVQTFQIRLQRTGPSKQHLRLATALTVDCCMYNMFTTTGINELHRDAPYRPRKTIRRRAHSCTYVRPCKPTLACRAILVYS